MHLVHAFIAVSGTSAGLSQILRNGGLHRQNMAFSHELKHSVKPSRSARKSVKMLTSSDQNDRSSMSETKSMASRSTSKKSSTGTSTRHTICCSSADMRCEYSQYVSATSGVGASRKPSSNPMTSVNTMSTACGTAMKRVHATGSGSVDPRGGGAWTGGRTNTPAPNGSRRMIGPRTSHGNTSAARTHASTSAIVANTTISLRGRAATVFATNVY